MVYKHFTLNIAIRVILLSATLFCLIFLVVIRSDKNLLVTLIVLGVFLILQVYDLYRWLNKTSRILQRFFEAINTTDFTLKFDHTNHPKQTNSLQKSLNETLEKINSIRIEQSAQLQFLNYMIQHLETGIISWDTSGKVRLMNPGALRLLGLDHSLPFSEFKERFKPLFERSNKGKQWSSYPVELKLHGYHRTLHVSQRTFTLLEEQFHLLTVEDISQEIQRKENETWQKLLKILTHEIRNSVTPLSSISETLSMLWSTDEKKPKPIKELTEQNIHDSWMGVQTINDRSEKLLTFVNNVLNLSALPEPKKAEVKVLDLLNKLVQLMSYEKGAEKVVFKTDVHPNNLVIEADPVQLEQVIINLISNALYALIASSSPILNMCAHISGTQVSIEIQDNGKGINPEHLDQVFIPFFTTRKEGTGLGLSLCRQIMNLHGGLIGVDSVPGEWTRFTLLFPL